jgi:hypothetical protein
VVEKKYEKLLTENRVVATLDVKVEFTKSRNLLIGNSENPERVYYIPADTTFGGEGIEPQEVEEFIKKHSEEIKNGKITLAVLGAQSYNLGKEYLLELYPHLEEKLERAPLKGVF